MLNFNLKRISKYFIALFLIAVMIQPVEVSAEGLPYLNIVQESSTKSENAFAVKQLIMLSVLTVAPSIILIITPFTRISITLSLMRQALGLNQTPSNQVLLTLALFMSVIGVGPLLSQLNENSITPYMNDKITIEQAIENANKPIREYMFHQTGKSELSLFINLNANINKEEIPKTYADIPNSVLYPAYITSEIKAGIFIGIIISIAFVIIDMAVAGILMGMGMMMVQPATISTIFKMMLFIFANGFELVIQTVMLSIN